MPLYPPHFARGTEFLQSFYKYKIKADIAIVFSSNTDMIAFKALNLDFKFHSIIMDFTPKNKNATAATKKFYGLLTCAKKYDFSILLDAETLIIKHANVAKMCTEFFKQKIIYANHTTGNVSRIHKHVGKYFNNELFHPDLYSWFDQLFIFKNAHLAHFFEFTKIDKNIKELDWADFEHIIYAQYLIKFHGFKIVDLGLLSTWGSFERADFLVEYNLYLRLKIWHGNIKTYQFFNTKNIFILVQLDRIGTDNLYDKKDKIIIKGAQNRVKDMLSFRLGFALLNSKNICEKMCKLLSVYFKFKKEQRLYKNNVAKNEKLSLIPLQFYADYKEGLKLMKEKEFMLGKSIIRCIKEKKFLRLFKLILSKN